MSDQKLDRDQVFAQFAALTDETSDVNTMLDAARVAHAVLKALTPFAHRDLARVLLVGVALVEYVTTELTLALVEASSPRAEFQQLEQLCGVVMDRAYALSELVRARQQHEQASGVPVRTVVEGSRVLFVNPDGEAVDGYEITSVNAPGSTDTN